MGTDSRWLVPGGAGSVRPSCPLSFAEISSLPRRDRFEAPARRTPGTPGVSASRTAMAPRAFGSSYRPTRTAKPRSHTDPHCAWRTLSRPAECPGNPPRPSCVLRHTGPSSTAHPGSTQHQLCRGVHRERVRLGTSSKNRKRRPRKKGKKARTGMTGSQKAQTWRTALEMPPPSIWALAALINALTGR